MTTSATHEVRAGDAIASDRREWLDVGVIHGFLSRSYWAGGIPVEVVGRSMEHSICFGVYIERDDSSRVQVGFARVITDRATFAYLADVFVLEEHRGRGLSALLMRAIMSHPDLQNLRRFMLITRDAHGLYAKFGFGQAASPDRIMERTDPEIYRRARSQAPG